MSKVQLGLVFEINGKPVSVSPKQAISDFKALKEKGIEFTLPERIELGTIEKLDDFLERQFGAEFSLPEASDFPSPLDQAYAKLEEIVLAVESFHLKVLGTQEKADKGRSADYSIGLSATWPIGEQLDLIEKVLAIKGVYLKLSNEGETAPPAQ